MHPRVVPPDFATDIPLMEPAKLLVVRTNINRRGVCSTWYPAGVEPAHQHCNRVVENLQVLSVWRLATQVRRRPNRNDKGFRAVI